MYFNKKYHVRGESHINMNHSTVENIRTEKTHADTKYIGMDILYSYINRYNWKYDTFITEDNFVVYHIDLHHIFLCAGFDFQYIALGCINIYMPD